MNTIVIIGAGFSGVALAMQLVRQKGTVPLRIALVDRANRMARGLAYDTRSPDHVLNAPAGKMSALGEDPTHFLRFIQARDASVEAHSFVLRGVYGDYLENLLESLEQSPPSNVSIERICAEATSIQAGTQGMQVSLSNGKMIDADKIVLAFGHLPPPHPFGETSEFFSSKRYIRNPWEMEALDAIPRDAPVLLIGTGLSALDVCMALLNASPKRMIHMISRRGLLPKAHRVGPQRTSGHSLPAIFSRPGASVRQLLRELRQHVRVLQEEGGDWREPLAQMRPCTHLHWQAWGAAERRRFLRHVQPYWDNHRHLAAPEPFRRFERALNAGNIRVHAGRISNFVMGEADVSAHLRLRGRNEQFRLDTAYVINCIGSNGDLHKTNNPLVSQLLKDGAIQSDELRLGIAVDENCRVLCSDGVALPNVYYIGPLLKARCWEATAVPELREFAARLGSTLMQAS